MESNGFGGSHLPSQALVVLSEAASGLHEALRNQRPFPTRLPDAKDLHNISLVGNYGTHLLHSFHPHLLQSLNHGMLANGGPANYFASDRGLSKPSVLTNFQLPSAFSPPKYIGISLDQNLFNSSSESFRTDSASPTCTSHESMDGSNDYDGEKGESPRSNNSDARDLRHVHSSNGGGQQKSTVGSSRNHVLDVCPVCGIKLTPEEWNSHFLAELDRLYKLSAGMERANLQSNYMFAPPCPAQENAIRTSHNRWETFQRIRNNRQNRLRIKVRKRKYGDMYFLDNLFCSSCPICKRKYSMDIAKNSEDEPPQSKEEIETVDVESCNDDVPDSGSEMNSSSSSAPKLNGILYRSTCVINKESAEDDVTNSNNWDSNSSPHISVKSVSELSSTTHHFYNADSCGEERSCNSKEIDVNACNNDSDEDVIVDDDDTVKAITGKKRKFDDSSNTRNENISPDEDRPRSEPQVTSTEPNIEISTNTNNNNNSNLKYNFEDLRSKLSESENNGSQNSTPAAPGGILPDSKTGIKEFSSDFFRGRNLYFHQSCANVMSTYRLGKDLQQQQQHIGHHQQLLQQQQQQQQQQQHQHQLQQNLSNN